MSVTVERRRRARMHSEVGGWSEEAFDGSRPAYINRSMHRRAGLSLGEPMPRRQTTPRLPLGASRRPRDQSNMLGSVWQCLPMVLRMEAREANEGSLMQGQISSAVQPIQTSGTTTCFEIDMDMFSMPKIQLAALSLPTCISTPCTSWKTTDLPL